MIPGQRLALPDSPLLKMAVQTANVLMAMNIGGKLTLATNPSSVLVKHRVETPMRTGWYT